ARTGQFEVVCSQDSRKDITAENLAKFDAVFFYTTGELPLSDTQKADLLAFVKKGGGFAGTHSATDTFYKWPEYRKLIGRYCNGHPWHQKIKVLVEDKNHPAARPLGDAFEITDEISQFKGPYSRDKLHVLMRMDVKSVDKPGGRNDQDYALAWTHEYGKGRVFYTALGHRAEVWKDERFQQLIVGGLRYITGLENADATPPPLPRGAVVGGAVPRRALGERSVGALAQGSRLNGWGFTPPARLAYPLPPPPAARPPARAGGKPCPAASSDAVRPV